MESQREWTLQNIALNNPIILTEILKQASIPLKNCRLVSHFWNHIVLSIPNTRLALNPNKKDAEHGDYLVPFFEICSTLDPHLARRISARTLFYSRTTTYSFAAQLTYLCGKFSDQIQDLGVIIHHKECVQVVFQILKNYCPNLKTLRIRCDFNEEGHVPSGEILLARLPQKTYLTVFQLQAGGVRPFLTLTSFTQLVFNASPNLKKITLPLGIYPDLKYFKSLDSLTLKLNDGQELDVALINLKPSDLTRMLAQVGDQLVHLAFSYCWMNEGYSMQVDYDLDNSTRSRFRLPRRMPKLRIFKNDMIDIIQHADFWQDIVGMPALESLKIGKISKKSTSVDAVFKNLSETGRIYSKVTDLRINELYDPKLLDGLKTAFPNLRRLGLDSMYETEVAGMELGVVFKACADLDTLNRLDLWLPTYPERVLDVIKGLMDGSKFYKEMNSLEIRKNGSKFVRHELTDGEMHLFKRLLVTMKEMGRVVIHDLHFDEKSRRNLLDFMASSEMPVSQFKVVM
ncbi:uncharacterized protein LOC110862387 isoform X1 [Folsomia candida]|nr:uncharacterized protein LOC110862387 isoform X1 [Folsomia candida]